MTDFELASARIPLFGQGIHTPDGVGCAMEYLSVGRGIPWTDSPDKVRCFDLRSINDIEVSNEVRTRYLLPVLKVYDGSLDWPLKRQRQVVDRIVTLTVQRLIAELPGLPESIRLQCRLAAAAEATRAAAWAAAEAAWAARAAWAAAEAAGAAAEAQVEQVFRATCQLWLEAAQEPEGAAND